MLSKEHTMKMILVASFGILLSSCNNDTGRYQLTVENAGWRTIYRKFDTQTGRVWQMYSAYKDNDWHELGTGKADKTIQ
jgi:hypothetical protein